MVRNKIKMFAQKKVNLAPGRQKVVILDEADRYPYPQAGMPRREMGSLTAHVLFLRGVSSMTSAAQQALRRTMEIYSNTTRFALACNVSSKIIEPIQSRCAILRYTRLGDEQVLKRLMEVIKAEGVRHCLLLNAACDLDLIPLLFLSEHSTHG